MMSKFQITYLVDFASYTASYLRAWIVRSILEKKKKHKFNYRPFVSTMIFFKKKNMQNIFHFGEAKADVQTLVHHAIHIHKQVIRMVFLNKYDRLG